MRIQFFPSEEEGTIVGTDYLRLGMAERVLNYAVSGVGREYAGGGIVELKAMSNKKHSNASFARVIRLFKIQLARTLIAVGGRDRVVRDSAPRRHPAVLCFTKQLTQPHASSMELGF